MSPPVLTSPAVGWQLRARRLRPAAGPRGGKFRGSLSEANVAAAAAAASSKPKSAAAAAAPTGGGKRRKAGDQAAAAAAAGGVKEEEDGGEEDGGEEFKSPLQELRRVACSPHREGWQWVAAGGLAGLLHFSRVVGHRDDL